MPRLCLAYISRYTEGYTVYEHYATYFVKGAHARTAKSERVISRWQVIRDLSALYATSASDVPLRCHWYTKTHECVGTWRRHVSNIGQPSRTTWGGTVLDGNWTLCVPQKYPHEGITEPFCVTLWTRILVSTTGDRVTKSKWTKLRRTWRFRNVW